MASKTFNSAFPGLKFINLQWRLKWYLESRSRVSSSSNSSQFTPSLKRVFLNLVSNLSALESVRIGVENPPPDVLNADVEDDGDDLHITDGGFVKEWLPRVSGALKLLSLSDFWVQSSTRRSEVLSLISAHCQNLIELELKNAWLSGQNMNAMPMLTSLTLELIRLDDKNLTEFNTSFPNLQVLNLIDVRGLKMPMIHLLNLKTCHWIVTDSPSYICIITPNLITLRLECRSPAALYIEAPLCYNLHLAVDHLNTFAVKKFENLKIVQLESSNIHSVICKFRMETVETLTLDIRAGGNSKFTLEDLLCTLPNITSLCFKPRVWSEFEVWCGNIGLKGVKRFCGYLSVVDPLMIFALVDCVLEECFNCVEISLLIHRSVAPNISKRFITRCMAEWPEVKWTWGIWEEGREDYWMTVEQLL
ncbi:F-box/LRR-repeat protein At4g29420-like [Lactuca sativa]|nr:F-box/LRR-repeat protein At4g29420-like [Lactuca sativa]